MNARLHHKPVHTRHFLKRFRVCTRNYLSDILKSVDLVAGIDPLRGVSHPEIPAAFKPRGVFKRRNTNLLGDPGVDGRLKNNNTPRHKISADHAAGFLHRRKVRRMIVVYRCGNGNNVEARLTQSPLVRGEFDRAVSYSIVPHLPGRVNARIICLNLALIQVKADNSQLF